MEECGITNLNEGIIDRTEKFTRLNLVITNNCNKNCHYCALMITKNRKKITYMTIEDYKYIISCMDKEDRENFRTIIVTGGEPILHPKLIEILKLVREDFPKAEITLSSNGRLLNTLPQKNLRILPNIKNLICNISHYPGWNDEIRERYDCSKKLPSIYRRIIRKITRWNKYIEMFSFNYRLPMKKIRRFLEDPLKKGNVFFIDFAGFQNPFNNPNLSEVLAKIIRKVCMYNIHIVGRRLYNCCGIEAFERCYNLKGVSVEFDKNWKRNWFKLPTWKACVHCQYGYDRYRTIYAESKMGYKKRKLITLEERRKAIRLLGHE